MVLSEVSIRRPVFAWMLMAGLIGIGALCYTRLGISQLPDVDFPVISISLQMDGASPESMEQDVVDIIEDQMMSIEGVQTVRSTSAEGKASVSVEFDLKRDVDKALQDVQAKVAQAQRNLPPALYPPSLTKTNPDDMPIYYVALVAPDVPAPDLMKYARNVLKNKFAGVAGVGDISIGGYREPNMRVWVKNDQLKKFNLASSDVVDTLKNEQVDPPTGRVAQNKKEYNVRFLGENSTANDFMRLPLDRNAGQDAQWKPPKLGDVARVVEDTEDTTTMARAEGVGAVTFGIIKQRGSNAVEVASALQKRIQLLQTSMPKGMTLKPIFDTTIFIREAISELLVNLVLSAILTSIVCWLFLGSLSSTINVLFAIPTSIIGALTVVYFMGFTLNTFTLLALSLAIGIVVDDAIMVLENINRHRNLGKGQVRAALNGAKEITPAATAASISVVAIFLPVAFMNGLIGKFFFQFGVVLSATVLISLLEALTLTPMRAAVMKADENDADGHPKSKIGRIGSKVHTWMEHQYARVLGPALNHKWITIGICTAIAAASFLALPGLRKEFMPPEDQSRFIVRVQAPAGTSLSNTDDLIKQVEALLKKTPEVQTFLSSIGGGGAAGDLNTGIVSVTLKSPSDRPKDSEAKHRLNQQEVMQRMRKQLASVKGARFSMQDLAMRGLTTSRGTPIDFSVRGPDWTKLAELSGAMMTEMRNSGVMSDVDTDLKDGMPEVQVVPDRDKVSKEGVSLQAVGGVINTMVAGERVAQYSSGGHRYDVRVKSDGVEDREIHDELKGLTVRNSVGNLVPLTDVVNLENKKVPQSVSRQDRERAVTIYANVVGGHAQQEAIDLLAVIAKKVLPEGYSIVQNGSAKTFQESFQSLIVALALGIAVAYMILATQFNSFIDPVSVLVALPFSVSGAFVALIVTGQSLNIYSMIGIILLMGIAKKNSILLVEFTNETRDHDKLDVQEALLKACPIRLRPIIMTSVATVAGAIPPALALGPGAESRIPMAVTIIGGVIVSTVFTLLFVPCVYLVLSRFERRESLLEREERAGADSLEAESNSPAVPAH